jgi:hypothetical protein
MKDKTQTMFQTLEIRSSFVNLDLDLFDFKFVSDFDIRISDFLPVVTSRDKGTG